MSACSESVSAEVPLEEAEEMLPPATCTEQLHREGIFRPPHPQGSPFLPCDYKSLRVFTQTHSLVEPKEEGGRTEKTPTSKIAGITITT